MRSIKHISIIGSGNVATHLGCVLHKRGLIIDSVFSRKLSRAKKLANQISAKPCSKFKQLNLESDLYIIAVSDDAIKEVANKLVKLISADSIIVHTSGSVNSRALKAGKSGVFYPLQSFTINRDVDFRSVPICIHSADEKIEKLLLALARKLSKSVYRINDDQRSKLHLAAVFASNFSNHMYHLASKICEENEVDFNILKPLILETATKIKDGSPHDMQTGPARRRDTTTINKHLSQLAKDKAAKEIYKLASMNIKKQYK